MAEDNKAKDAAKAVENKMGDLEKKLDKQSEKLPQLSKEQKNAIVGPLPWALGAYGVLNVFWILDLWDAIDAVDQVNNYLGGFASSVLPSKTNMWVALVLFLVVAVSIGMAFSKGVLNKTKAGWNFLFYSMVVSVLAGLWWLLGLSELGKGRVVWTLGVGLLGLYGLFQVREAFSKK